MSKVRVVGSFSLLAFLVPFLITGAMVFGLGIGTGYLFRWLFRIELGLAILSGLVAITATIYFGLKLLKSLDDSRALLRSMEEMAESDDNEYWTEDDDDLPARVTRPRHSNKRRNRR